MNKLEQAEHEFEIAKGNLEKARKEHNNIEAWLKKREVVSAIATAKFGEYGHGWAHITYDNVYDRKLVENVYQRVWDAFENAAIKQ